MEIPIMAINAGPKIIEDGLVFCVDAANPRSYPGAGTIWYDLSNNNYDGTLINGASFDSANAGSISFDGTNDRADFPSGIMDTGTITVCWWQKGWDGARRVTILEMGTTSDEVYGGGGIYFNEGTNGGELQFRLFILNNTNVTERISVQSATKFNNLADTWKYCVVNWDGTTNAGNMKIYIDGEFDNQNNGGNSVQKNWLGPWIIGDGIQSSQLVNYQGSIASLSIYNRVLSAEEIRRNYNSTRGRFE
jgi:hypothetical protein